MKTHDSDYYAHGVDESVIALQRELNDALLRIRLLEARTQGVCGYVPPDPMPSNPHQPLTDAQNSLLRPANSTLRDE